MGILCVLGSKQESADHTTVCFSKLKHLNLQNPDEAEGMLELKNLGLMRKSFGDQALLHFLVSYETIYQKK